MFREIRTSEKITDRFDESKMNYRKIKPKENTPFTIKEMDDFIKQIFEEARAESV